jgi:hypothetical protein
MSEPDKPNRKFWQFHLSTALLLVLAAGAISMANFAPRETANPMEGVAPFKLAYSTIRLFKSGWPMKIYHWKMYDDKGTLIADFWTDGTGANGERTNLLVAIGLLAVLAVTLESFVRRKGRRRKARKP